MILLIKCYTYRGVIKSLLYLILEERLNILILHLYKLILVGYALKYSYILLQML